MPKNNHDKEKKATHLYNEKYLNFAVKSTFKPCSPELNGKTLIGRITFSFCDGWINENLKIMEHWKQTDSKYLLFKENGIHLKNRK